MNDKHTIQDHSEEIPKERTIKWDLTEAENYINSSDHADHEHMKSKRIPDPKTPYVEIEETDDVYLNKLKEVNKMHVSKESLEEVCKKIEEHNHDVETEEKKKKRV